MKDTWNMLFENPSRYITNPPHLGPGVYIGMKLKKSERLLLIVFTWLSRTGAAPAIYGQQLPDYQALHLAAMTALLARGRQVIDAKAASQGITESVPNTNYTYNKASNEYWVHYEPSNEWLETGLSPQLIRSSAQSWIGTPSYNRVMSVLQAGASPEIRAGEAERRRFERKAEEEARAAARAEASYARREARAQEEAAAWQASQVRARERAREREAQRAVRAASAEERGRVRALLAAVKQEIRDGFGGRVASRVRYVTQEQLLVVALPTDYMVQSAMSNLVTAFRMTAARYNYTVSQAASTVVVFSPVGMVVSRGVVAAALG